MKNKIQTVFKLVKLEDDNRIADNYAVAGHKCKVGFISSISNHFCDSCNRLRITATGKIKLCLFSSEEQTSLKYYLVNRNISDEEIAERISQSLQFKQAKHPEVEELVKLHHNNMLNIGG